MTVIDGQLTIFDVLAPKRLVKLPFTVTTGPNKYELEFCAYCGSKKNLNEGGCGPAGTGGPSYNYSICNPCSDRYRTMRPPPSQWTYKEIS